MDVCLLGDSLEPADLVAIGSHCQGLDLILNHFHEQGGISKYLTLGSHGGIRAVKNGECDIAGIHLLDPVTNVYNIPFLNSELDLIPGYKRQQGVVLGFLPIVDEIFDFVVLKSRRERDSVKRFCNLLFDNKIREELSHLGLTAY